MGYDETSRFYALCIDYSRIPAYLTLYHTDPLPEAGKRTIPVLTAEGNLMLTGGVGTEPNSNFAPVSSVWLLRFNEEGSEKAATKGWLWGIVAAILVMSLVAYVVWRRKSKSLPMPERQVTPSQAKGDIRLMERICELMEGQQFYLQQGLKVSDIASALGTNSRYISECVRAERGISFTQFVNEYRVAYAKRLLIEQPDKKMSAVAIDSGFSNDKALTRSFKDLTGLTPTEWKTQANSAQNQ